MNGHKDYEFLNIEQRKVMLAYFSSFVRRLPISYVTLVYRRSQFEDPARLMERMGRDSPPPWLSTWLLPILRRCEGLLRQRPGHRQAGTRPLRGQGPFKRGRPSTQDVDDRLPPRASGGLSLHHRTRPSQVRGQGGWRDIQQILRRHRLFQEELAQASPQQADIAGPAASQGTVSSPSVRRQTAGEKPQATNFEQRNPKRKQEHRGH